MYILITNLLFISTTTKQGAYKCQGSIDMYMLSDDGDFNMATFRGANYPQFVKRLNKPKKKKAFEAEVKGDCCWELYKFTKFNGARHAVLLESGRHQLPIQPKSMKKLPCF